MVFPFFEAFPFEADFRRLAPGLARLLAGLVFVFRVLFVAIVMFLPGVEKQAKDHANRSTRPRRIPEVAEGLASRRASIPENRGRLWHLGSGLRVADSRQVAGWSKGLFPHTSRDACVVVFPVTGSSSFPAGDLSRQQLDRVHVHLGVPFRKRSPVPGPYRAEPARKANNRRGVRDPVKAKIGHSLLLSEAASQPAFGSVGTLATKPGCRV